MNAFQVALCDVGITVSSSRLFKYPFWSIEV